MKISRVTPHLVDRCLIVRVETDAGLTGIGEAGLWAHHRIVAAAITELGEYFQGKNPRHIEHHFQAVARNTHFGGAVLSAAQSAIDIALWDLLGKEAGLPVYQLLGGKVRDKVRVFANVLGETPEARAAHARELVSKGFKSLRTTPFVGQWERNSPTKFITDAIAITGSIRDAVGYEIDLGLEIHRNLTPGEAVTLGQALGDMRLLYFEDPNPPESLDALAYVARHVNIPLAAGERSHNIYQFKELLDLGAAAMIRPDLSLAGGFTQVKKIAGMAEASFVQIFPHLMGSPVNVAAFVQLAAATPNYMLMESGPTGPSDLVTAPLTVEDGYLPVPDRPGIGVELDESRLAAYPIRTHPIAPPLSEDGAIAH